MSRDKPWTGNPSHSWNGTRNITWIDPGTLDTTLLPAAGIIGLGSTIFSTITVKQQFYCPYIIRQLDPKC
jgi:hypothetical protein